jgi:hypothetical protein
LRRGGEIEGTSPTLLPQTEGGDDVHPVLEPLLGSPPLLCRLCLQQSWTPRAPSFSFPCVNEPVLRDKGLEALPPQ